jgi:hypothetical protein
MKLKSSSEDMSLPGIKETYQISVKEKVAKKEPSGKIILLN